MGRKKKSMKPKKKKPCVCAVCGKEFEPLKRRGLYCSKICKEKQHYRNKKEKRMYEHLIEIKAYVPKMTTCKICGSEFLPSDPRIKYCGSSCRQEAMELQVSNVDWDRPFTNETVYLVKLWYDNGDSVSKISRALFRPVEVIEAIVRGDYDEYEREAIKASVLEGYAEDDFDVQEWA